MDKNWMHVPNRFTSPEYSEGINKLLTMAKAHAPGSTTFRCPCRRCCNNLFLPINELEDHLFIIGIDPSYTRWIFHGEGESPIVNSTDNDEDTYNDSHNFVDDMDEMIEDTRAATFMDHAYGEHDHGTTSPPTVSEGQSKTFAQMFEDARRPLYPSCEKFSKLSFIVKLLHIKTIGGWTIKSFNMVLQLLKAVFPDIEIPNSYLEARRLERGLGFSYVKIHACPNDCMLFWKHNADKENCSKCNESRWVSTSGKNGKIPQKVLRHFPIIPRLQRLFMSKSIAKEMKWHKEQRVDDHSTLRHPADSKMWRQFNKDHSWFAQESRNVRLGLASDGFNPYNNMAKPYSIWPVILVPYNLPPWLCMKDPYLMLSLLIPGPKAPGNDIDVYLQPLVNELKELWDIGVNTYDASTSGQFRLHAALLWTINDFPAYANLSGWSTKGKLACPLCNENTESMWLKHGRKHCYMGHRRFLPFGHSWRKKKSAFNGSDDHRLPPPELTGHDLLHQLLQVGNVEFGKGSRKRKRRPDHLNWTKESIFFQLPYWSTLSLRHNLDVMHIEKNICDNVLGTLMDIDGKTKDIVNARKDLMELGLRKDLHLQPSSTGYSMLLGSYTLDKHQRRCFCEWLAAVKFSDGFASNISRCVSIGDGKISGMKSHDCHVFMQRLLPVAIGGYFRPDIRLALTEFSSFFKALCARTFLLQVVSTRDRKLAADFVLDWNLKNHRRTVTSQLSRAYNAFHYKLHKKYLNYASHEEAVANGGALVEKPVWEWLCNRWVSDDFKKMSTQNKENRRMQRVNHTSGRTSFVVLMERKKDKNLIDFYKDVHWSKKKGRFITPTTEDNYNQMVQLMNDKDPEARTDEAAATIFREVLGHRSGYSRGLGHSVMPESIKVGGVSNEEYERLALENNENRRNAEYYQNRLEEIEGGFRMMREHMQEYEQRVNMRMSEVETELESQRETQTIVP